MTPSTQRKIIIALIIAGVLIVGFFGLRAAHAFREFRGHPPPPLPFPGANAEQPIETDVELIRDWMTVPFISRMYAVPPHILLDALEIPPEGNQEKSLRELNDEYYPQAEGIVMEKVKAAILAHQPPPAPEPPPEETPSTP